MLGKVTCKDCGQKYEVQPADVRVRDGSREQWVTCPSCSHDQEIDFKLQLEPSVQ
jgi:transcription elongation factor Elf1